MYHLKKVGAPFWSALEMVGAPLQFRIPLPLGTPICPPFSEPHPIFQSAATTPTHTS